MNKIPALLAVEVVEAAVRHFDALTVMLPYVATRAVSRAESMLEGEWQSSLRPPLMDTYRAPVNNGLEDVYGKSRRTIAAWVKEFFRDHPGVTSPVSSNLNDYGERGYNLGGQLGLNDLGLLASFNLQDERIKRRILTEMNKLGNVDGVMSLHRTTANDLALVMDRAYEDDKPYSEFVRTVGTIALVRTVIRTAVIAQTESVRMTRWGMASAFVGNGVKTVVHQCEADVELLCSTGVCPPLCGVEFQLRGVVNPLQLIGGQERIPLHPGCRCTYQPNMDGWLKPAVIWTGFALS